MMIDAILQKRGLSLPAAAKPAANYEPYQICGNQLIISGQLPIVDGKPAFIGRIGDDLTVDDGIKAAQHCLLNILAQAQDALGGDLSKIKKTIRLGVFVQAVDGFTQQPQIANGASDLIVELLQDAGKHARAAVGVHTLPLGVCVEIEASFEILI